MENPGFDAVLWDFDGTLVDTEGIWLEEELALARAYDVVLPERFWAETVGGSVLNTCTYFAARTPRPVAPETLAAELTERMARRNAATAPAWLPGVPELLAEVHAAGIAQACVSASWRAILDPVLAQLPAGTFAAVVSGDQVERSKPDPEPYLTAAARLGVDPLRCLAIEDSPTGATSANAAGCVVLAVSSVVAVPAAPRRVARRSLAGVDLAELARIFADGARA